MIRRPSDTRNGADRWMVSYADLVTLLFAFFTTLYAASTVDARKMTPMATSLHEAFAAHEAPAAPEPRDSAAAAPVARRDDDLYRHLAGALQGAIDEQRLELIRDARGIVVTLPDDATFAVGSAEVTPEARALIAVVGNALGEVANHIRIEGHTDDVPIRTSRYQSNWELSTARAAAVVAFLVTSAGIESGRLSAAGYGEFHPRGPNGSPADRARNRRVDLVILETSGHGA
jgi:chemotaxis protein MotB